MNNIIEADNLTFAYTGEPILHSVSFRVNKGDFVAIIGSNGTGKSTLLRLLLGELSPQKGSVRVLGQEVGQLRDWTKIGYVPQNAAAAAEGFPASVLEVVSANLYAQVGFLQRAKKEHRSLALTALEQVGMRDKANELIGNLSGGQQQRVMLARVLVGQPDCMLLDEPTTGVDAASSQSLYQLLEKLNRETGLTVVMVTHDIARASCYVTRTLCLEHGTMVELDREQLTHELSHKHSHPQCPTNTTAGKDDTTHGDL